MTQLRPRPRDAAERPLPSDVVAWPDAFTICARLEFMLGRQDARRYLERWFPAWAVRYYG